MVAGIRTLSQFLPGRGDAEVHQELVRICELLERHYRDMQDLEFTVEKGRLYILQTRAGKRTAAASHSYRCRNGIRRFAN